MSRSSLLVLLCVVTLSHVELGKSQCDGKRMSGFFLLEILLVCDFVQFQE